MAKKRKKGGTASFLLSTPTLAISAGLLGGAKSLAPLVKHIKTLERAGKFVGKEKALRALKMKEYPKIFLPMAALHGGATAVTATALKKLHLQSLKERKGDLKKYEREALRGINA